ncbi:helix-turn-helix transcriptional regulator [Intrasporangium flavum]|uniref:helix-turn-helix transcriptional regulator n=1 Tax=Intrasporangium flavum TaxID=1428657 RepID=UPI00096DA859|nr:helix-turn-helix transcriptional regulator [Intrasporangium flavum]
MDSVVFDSTDLGRIEAFLSDAYAPMRIGSTTPDPHAHVDRVEGPDALSIDHLDVGFTMRYDVLPLGRISLCSVHEGAIAGHRVGGGRRSRSFGAGEVFTLAPPDRPYAGTVDRARYSVTMFDPQLLTELAPGRDDDLSPVRLLDHRPLTARRGRALSEAIEDAARALAHPATAEHALSRQAVSHAVATAVLHAFPTTADISPTVADREDAASSTALSRALDHIEAHAADPLTLAELADAAGVTPRALQQAFRRHLETTPSEYLRRVRLDRARRDLSLGQRDDGTTVTDVAMRWGFYHQGRFAAAYRRRFGEAPHETLQDDRRRVRG